MNENKRFTIKFQDNYFGVTDNLTEDKVNVVNGIHAEIEAKWLCDLLNGFIDEIIERDKEILRLKGRLETYGKGCHEIYNDKCKLEEEVQELREAMKRLMMDMMTR